MDRSIKNELEMPFEFIPQHAGLLFLILIDPVPPVTRVTGIANEVQIRGLLLSGEKVTARLHVER